MASPKNIDAQTPGQPADATPADELAPLLDLSPVDLAAGLAGLTDAEVNLLTELEQARLDDDGNPRTAYRDILGAEQMRRLEDNQDTPTERELNAEAVRAIGDARDYAGMLARDIDPANIERPVLTLDGWLLPGARAVGE